ncbi:alpha/beta fold hydrolase [Nocardia sp. GCM10030253]|uniref:alpha/beta fold hydrolase n=1 Tax=Nocardia sp. GCM10030253 TaxID=3273404 RepID=UPI00363FB324
MSLPLIFVHGIRLSGMSWSVVREQLGQHPSAAVDLPGHGARRGEQFTLAAAIDTVAEAVDNVGGRAVVVGHSLGGYVSIAAAARHPERVAGLVVAGASCVPNRGFTTPFTLIHRVLSRQPDGGERASGRIFDAMLPPQVAAAIKLGGIATEVIPDVIRASTQFDPLTNLAAYPGPLWLINGSRDHFRSHERRFLAASTNGRLLITPRAGHYLPLAHPAEFARSVLDISHAVAGQRSSTWPPAASTR